jgi:hypothetical protein
MTTLSVDPERLGQEAETLGGQVSATDTARDELTRATATAQGSCGSVSDGGLHSALRQLDEAWGYEITAIGSDMASVASLMKRLSQAYAKLDGQGAAQINGG